jgi:hypothetical protein
MPCGLVVAVAVFDPLSATLTPPRAKPSELTIWPLMA